MFETNHYKLLILQLSFRFSTPGSNMPVRRGESNEQTAPIPENATPSPSTRTNSFILFSWRHTQTAHLLAALIGELYGELNGILDGDVQDSYGGSSFWSTLSDWSLEELLSAPGNWDIERSFP